MTLQASPAAYDIIKEFEGFVPDVYTDPTGTRTIGYGHTGRHVARETISQEEAEEILEEDVQTVLHALSELIEVPLKQNQLDAVISLVYNIGQGAFARSTLLRLLNMSNFEAAAREFPKWRLSKGIPLPGLKRRRAAERLLFIG